MSISRKIYNWILGIRKIVNRKEFRSIAMFSLFCLLFFGTMNVYAQEGVTPAWEGSKKFHNLITGLGKEGSDEDNMNSRQGLELLNTSWTTLSILVPEVSESYPDVLSSSEIPYNLKRGLIGMAEDASYTAYAIYPKVDVANHLAQQWVPGYDQSNAGVYASGYDNLTSSGIVPLWNRILNLSYVVFVIIMIAAGFMIMFRHKLGGQTMVTISNVLPGVIISLILATFSFAIAGLLIDLGGVVTNIVAFVLRGDGNYEIKSISNLWSIMFGSFANVGNELGNLSVIETSSPLFNKVLDAAPIVVGAIALFSGAGAVIALPALLFGIVTAVVLFFAAIKVLIVLYKAYFNILLSTLIAPIQITMGALPGNSRMIGNWFRGMLRNILTFPLVLAIINIPNVISEGTDKFVLSLPDSLTFDNNQGIADYLEMGIDISGAVFMIFFRIFILFFAAQAPKFLEGMFPAQKSEAMLAATGGLKSSLSKIPLVGSMFK